MLMDKEQSVLLVIDVQEKLLPAINEWRIVLGNVVWLIRVAKRLGLPVIASEQYPKGLGRSHPDVLAELPDGAVGEKLEFSCRQSSCLDALPGNERRQYVVCGMETHVCVLQTALDLKAAGKDVFVVADAVGSRTEENKNLALKRMRACGVDIVSREMVAVEWLKTAGTPLFKEISRDFLK